MLSMNSASIPGTGLRGYELLEVADGVVLVALDPNLLAESIVHSDLDHSSCKSLGKPGRRKG